MNHENAKRLLFEIADVVELTGLRYMLYGGTCLGAKRDKKFIDVDEDIDFACLNEDFVVLAHELVAKLEEAGMMVELIDHRHERPWNGLPYGIKIHKYDINADFFSHFRAGDFRFVPSHLGQFCLVHRREYLEQLTDLQFYERNFNIPKDWDGFLIEKYGDWRTPHESFHNVSKETCRKACKDGNDFWWL